MLQGSQFILIDIFLFAFGKAIKKKPTICKFRSDDGSRPAAFSLSSNGNPLLEDIPAQIRVNKPRIHFRNSVTQGVIAHAGLSHPARKSPGTKNSAHDKSYH